METKELTIEELDKKISELRMKRFELEKAEREKLKTEQGTRRKEVDRAYKEYMSLLNSYKRDYPNDFFTYLFNITLDN